MPRLQALNHHFTNITDFPSPNHNTYTRYIPIYCSDFLVKRALLSVSDKTGIADLPRGLAKLGIEIISTGGTAKII